MYYICYMKSHKSLRINEDVVKELNRVAKIQGRSFNNLVEMVLTSYASSTKLMSQGINPDLITVNHNVYNIEKK